MINIILTNHYSYFNIFYIRNILNNLTWINFKENKNDNFTNYIVKFKGLIIIY